MGKGHKKTPTHMTCVVKSLNFFFKLIKANAV